MNCGTSTSSCGSCSGCESAPAAAVEKPLGKITAILADLGLEVTYAYDDLVFVQHSAFLLQFLEDPTTLKLYTNTECNPQEANDTASSIVLEFDRSGFTLDPSGKYTLSQNEDETLRIEFCGCGN
ncbi:MAG: hypothetical protein HKP10_01645 [Kiritimatiellales bacterium]|nr:hypothetical protein [Kiritimatiellales bacterium]